jgi:methyl-accepting chemotaxis protein
MASGPFEFAKYRRPFQDRDAEGDAAETPTENLGELLGRVSENSRTQIDNLVGDFGRLREKLRVDGERIQRDVAEYRTLSEQVMQMTKTISESVEKVRGSAD